jgi:cyclase
VTSRIPARLAARLDVKNGRVIKGIQLEGLRVVGDPAEMAKRYYLDGADELVFIDPVATLYGRNSLFSIVAETARDVFVPLVVGGGIRSVDDIREALRHGADKVAINTAAVQRPEFISEAANAFGSQCVVLSVEAKRRPDGGWRAMTDNGREPSAFDVVEWVARAELLGAGEILLTSVDREGTESGFDLALVEAVHRAVRIPVVASGGAGSPEHVVDLFRRGICDAVACAAILHYAKHGIAEIKTALKSNGLEIRE